MGDPEEPDGIIAREVHVYGVVQGVFFRASCQEEADRVGVSGWVRNEYDGHVAAVLEGTPAAVAALLDWCSHGPRRAVVDRVDVTERAPTRAHGFEVR